MYEKMKQSPRGGFEGIFRFTHVADPKIRILVMVGVFVLLVVIVVGLGSYSKSEKAQQMVEAPPSPEVLPAASAITGVPAFDMKVAENVADDRPEARRRWPPEAMHYLLLEARDTPAVHAYKRSLFPINAESSAGIAKNSTPWRFKYVRFRGELEKIGEEDYEEVYGEMDPPLGRVHRGRVRVAAGASPVRVLFLTPLAPMWSDPNDSTARPEFKLIRDGWVRGRGIFVKSYVDPTDGAPVFLVVATKIERDYETVPVGKLEDIPFGIINDDPTIGQDEEARAILAKEYPRTLYRLVKYAEKRAGEGGAAVREAEGLVPEQIDSEKTWLEMIGQPSRFRARYVGGLGAIAMSPMRYDESTIEPNDAGVTAVLNGWIITDERKLFQFVAPASLDGSWPKLTRVRYAGFFYKTKLYPAGNRTDRLAPVLVLTRLEAIPPPKPDYVAQLIIAGAFILGVGLLIFIILREDKTKEGYRRYRRKRIVEAP